MQAVNHHFHLPQNPILRQTLCCIWQTDGFPDFQNEIILPKGIVEIIFDFGDCLPVQARLDKQSGTLARCFINGFNTSPIFLHHPEPHTYFGVQLQPVEVKNLLGVPAREFSNQTIDGALVHRELDTLWHQLAEKQAFEERVDIVSGWLLEQTIASSPQEKMLGAFLSNPAGKFKSVTQLADAICYSPRHLSRKMHENTGMNAEEMLQYKKYLHALHLMHDPSLSLTEIAYESGFVDQSHFIKCFQAYAQRTPGAYRRSLSKLPGHLFENVR